MKNKLILSKLLSGLDRQNLELALLLFGIPQKCDDDGSHQDFMIDLPRISEQKAAFIVWLGMTFNLKIRESDKAYIAMPIPYFIRKQAS